MFKRASLPPPAGERLKIRHPWRILSLTVNSVVTLFTSIKAHSALQSPSGIPAAPAGERLKIRHPWRILSLPVSGVVTPYTGCQGAPRLAISQRPPCRPPPERGMVQLAINLAAG
ncbi:MAG: hypothetical protein LBD20_09185 [Spirochaetaceae bacterium]|nr:hypothetical protein [Spirochaetaceae bacterium]